VIEHTPYHNMDSKIWPVPYHTYHSRVMIQTSTQAIYFYLVLLPIFISVHADNEIEVLRNLHSAYPDWKPRGIVDVGANGGGWTRAVQEEGLYPGVKIFMVEAFQYHSGSLEETKKTFADGDVDYAIAVLSSKDGESVKFHSIKNNDFSTGNSMFIEQTEHYNNNDAIFEYVNTTKLDTLLEDKMEHIDYLKLDVQVNICYPNYILYSHQIMLMVN
jgi:FkbM family methyltransferase